MVLFSRGLSFSFSGGPPYLLQHVDLAIPAGSAYGVLGQNGAGKSTLMKLMLGLLRPGAGLIRLFDRDPASDRRLFTRVGALIEEPRLYPHLSGWENLNVFATYRGIPSTRIGELLEIVDLTQAAQRPAGQYSTGMRQRLGIALALLPDPDLLFLDEPSNGLDPQGIADTRRLIQRLHRELGKTIILSSHLLYEMEQICTHVGILDGGGLRFQGTLDALRQKARLQQQLILEVEPFTETLVQLQRLGYTAAEVSPGQIGISIRGREEVPVLIDRLRQAGVAIYQVQLAENRLEDLFLQLLQQEP